jgi:hypothetical protein
VLRWERENIDDER